MCHMRDRNCFPFVSTWFHLQFVVGTVLPIFLVFCDVLGFCVWFVFVLCLVCQLLTMSLDCTFLIAPLVFSFIRKFYGGHHDLVTITKYLCNI